MTSNLEAMNFNLEVMASNLISTASNLRAMAFNLEALASNLQATASNLIAMASNLEATASNLIAMASNLEATASNLFVWIVKPKRVICSFCFTWVTGQHVCLLCCLSKQSTLSVTLTRRLQGIPTSSTWGFAVVFCWHQHSQTQRDFATKHCDGELVHMLCLLDTARTERPQEEPAIRTDAAKWKNRTN